MPARLLHAMERPARFAGTGGSDRTRCPPISGFELCTICADCAFNRHAPTGRLSRSRELVWGERVRWGVQFVTHRNAGGFCTILVLGLPNWCTPRCLTVPHGDIQRYAHL